MNIKGQSTTDQTNAVTGRKTKRIEPITDYDGAWKEIIEQHFTDFIKFFLPDVYSDIDWSRGYEFLDQELRKITQDAKISKRYTDRLVKVWRKDGTEKWVLIHIEVQSQQEIGFERRMYIYHYRLYDIYSRPVAAFVILGDTVKEWKPTEYKEELWGTELTFKYPVVKLRDYRTRWSELEASQNPFAVVVMAHLQTQESQNKPETRYKLKLQLIRRLYKIGLSRDEIINLFKFIDWLMWLPKELEQIFWQDVKELEEGESVSYITTGERIGYARGREEERLQSRRETIIQIIEYRFEIDEALRAELEERIQLIDSVTELKELVNFVLVVSDLRNFMDYLPTSDPEIETESAEQTVELTEGLPDHTLEKEYL